jgi:hypothetical protein
MCKEMQCQCSRRECAREKLEGQKVTEKTGVERGELGLLPGMMKCLRADTSTNGRHPITGCFEYLPQQYVKVPTFVICTSMAGKVMKTCILEGAVHILRSISYDNTH